MPPARLSLLLALLAGCSSENNLRREREAPVAAFQAPLWGDLLRQGDTLLPVVGTVSDSYDAPEDLRVSLHVGGDALPLSVDAHGLVTADYPLIGAALGSLELALVVQDSDGDIGEAFLEVQVLGPLGPPTVAISTPGDGAAYQTGDTIAFQGEASDETTAAEDLRFTWSSDLDGELSGAISAGGSSALITSLLSTGAHTITLTATDEDGESAADAILVLIEDEPIDEEPEEALPGDLMFSEMNVNPEAVDDEISEWVELYNTASYPIDIGGYTFRDDDIDTWELAGPILVQPQSYIVLCASLDVSINGGVPCDAWFNRDWNGGGIALANGPDELVLARPDGMEIDWLYYDDTWYTPAVGIGVDPEHLSAGDNDALSSWCNQSTVTPPMVEPGTPGRANDACP